ncbi:MAG: hypothetical protein K0R00_209 [Herbinix sp.]|jgi:hypothetical protein|nr:hypothetical protein [Herbinix sp.]
MTLQEAYASCDAGNFVSHLNFSSNESMHKYDGGLYYEDGANLTTSDFDLSQEEWAQDNWYIKFTQEKVDAEKLRKMHEDSRGYMLQCVSYEDCIIKTGEEELK